MYLPEQPVAEAANVVYSYWGLPASRVGSSAPLAVVEGSSGAKEGSFALVGETLTPDELSEAEVIKRAFLRTVMQRFQGITHPEASLSYYLEDPGYTQSGLYVAHLALRDPDHDPMFEITPESSDEVRERFERGGRPAGILPRDLAEYIDARLAHIDAFYNMQQAVWWDAEAVQRTMDERRQSGVDDQPITGEDLFDRIVANPEKRFTVYEYHPGGVQPDTNDEEPQVPKLVTILDITQATEPHLMNISQACEDKYENLDEVTIAQLAVLGLYMRRIIQTRYPELYATYCMIAGYQMPHPHDHILGAQIEEDEEQNPMLTADPFTRMMPGSGRSNVGAEKLSEVLSKATLLPEEHAAITAALDRVAVFYDYRDDFVEQYPALSRGTAIPGLSR